MPMPTTQGLKRGYRCGRCGRQLRTRSWGYGVVVLESQEPGPSASGRVFSCHPRHCGFEKELSNANVQKRIERAVAAGLDYVPID
jgi:hypothetical protein